MPCSCARPLTIRTYYAVICLLLPCNESAVFYHVELDALAGGRAQPCSPSRCWRLVGWARRGCCLCTCAQSMVLHVATFRSPARQSCMSASTPAPTPCQCAQLRATRIPASIDVAVQTSLDPTAGERILRPAGQAHRKGEVVLFRWASHAVSQVELATGCPYYR
jgi:hypothetical protein